MAAQFYKGDEVKFALNIDAQGFSMDDDDFEIEAVSTGGGSSIKGYKDATKASSTELVIFKKDSDSSESSSSDSSSSEESESQWFAILDTKNMAVGTIRIISTAYVPDANANDGVRTNIDVKVLGKLVNP